MTVAELIAKLQTMPSELSIMIRQWECDCSPEREEYLDDEYVELHTASLPHAKGQAHVVLG